MVMLVRFWANHHLLDLTQRPVWRVVKDRSCSYVHRILAGTRHSASSLPWAPFECMLDMRQHAPRVDCSCMRVVFLVTD